MNKLSDKMLKDYERGLDLSPPKEISRVPKPRKVHEENHRNLSRLMDEFEDSDTEVLYGEDESYIQDTYGSE